MYIYLAIYLAMYLSNSLTVFHHPFPFATCVKYVDIMSNSGIRYPTPSPRHVYDSAPSLGGEGGGGICPP